jgi:inositol hexakisphosphate/diphosphoinositol-pentakisphosphate kinase
MNKMVEYYKVRLLFKINIWTLICQDYLDFVIFPEESILQDPVEKWPLCDCLISFHSTDFPLKKAIEYEKLRRPYVLNDLQRQFDLVSNKSNHSKLKL